MIRSIYKLEFGMKLPNFEPKLFKWHSFLELNQRCDFLKFRALQDSKPQTQDPKSGALSIREGFNKKRKKISNFLPTHCFMIRDLNVSSQDFDKVTLFLDAIASLG